MTEAFWSKSFYFSVCIPSLFKLVTPRYLYFSLMCNPSHAIYVNYSYF